ncbi:hypothetical protein AGMMS50229_00450 [Campylobacterota bacterium]|nr:hypothetical protein AGMMS50229_00450 [Campylobacterota bacterium]
MKPKNLKTNADSSVAALLQNDRECHSERSEESKVLFAVSGNKRTRVALGEYNYTSDKNWSGDAVY